jgi:hypothetical protein
MHKRSLLLSGVMISLLTLPLNSQFSNATIYNHGDYSTAALTTLSLIQNLTQTLADAK